MRLFVKRFIASILILFILPTLAFSASRQIAVKSVGGDSQKRTALVIGNSNYQSSSLRNPVNDASDMAQALSNLGFQVTLGTDMTRKEMRLSIRAFGDKLNAGDVGLFYYAGHGMQVDGRNYLIPIGAKIEREDEIQDEAIDAGSVLRKMDTAGNIMNMVFLDACRDNPFARSFRSGNKGLAQMDAPSGSLIVYATAPGSVAADGDGRNGVFTKNLLAHINTQGEPLVQMMMKVRSNVRKETGGKQTPWESSSLEGNFYFAPPLKEQDINKAAEEELRKLQDELTQLENEGRQLQDRKLAEEKRRITALKRRETEIRRAREEKQEQAHKKKEERIQVAPLEPQKMVRLPVGEQGKKKAPEGMVHIVGSEYTAGLDAHQGYAECKKQYDALCRRDWYSDEMPHQETVRSFNIDAYEVTQEQFERVMGKNPSEFDGGFFGSNPSHPVEQVTWNEGKTYCQKVGKRLPTEWEWEYAARAGTTTVYYWGNNFDGAYAWTNENSDYTTHPVGQKKPNQFGLYDMAGNAMEWTGSDHDRGGKVLRGGSWPYSPSFMRSAGRFRIDPTVRSSHIGFRCAK
jgi:formylglycine-generating enzyme required for sulfatase activity